MINIRTGNATTVFVNSYGGSTKNCLAFSPYNDWLAACIYSAGIDYGYTGVLLWNLRESTSEIIYKAEFMDNLPAVTSLTFAPFRNILAIGMNDGNIQLWDVDLQEKKGNIRIPFDNIPYQWELAFSPNALLLAVSLDNRLLIVDTGTHNVKYFSDSPDEQQITRLNFNTESTQIAASTSSTSWIWDIGSGEILHTFEGQSDIDYSPTGSVILTRGMSEYIFYDALTFEPVGTISTNLENGKVAFHDDGSVVTIAAGEIEFWGIDNYAFDTVFDSQEMMAVAMPGQALFNEYGCSGCHPSKDIQGVGQSLRRMANTADTHEMSAEAFLIESIIQPAAYVEEGYGLVHPSNYGSRMTYEELKAIVAYILSYQEP